MVRFADMDTLVIDLETKKSFADVGGQQYIEKLGISVAGVYSYERNEFLAFEEHEVGRLEEMLASCDRIIGFNINHFDIPVLRPYLKDTRVLDRIAVVDMYEDAVKFLGHRVGLQALAKATLGASKSSNGLEALEWFKQGRVQEVKDYCVQDVRLTRDLFEFGRTHGHVLFESFVDGKVHSIPVQWKEAPAMPIARVVEDAFNSRMRLRMEYVSAENGDGLGFQKSRLVDVYGIKGNGEFEAYCHLRKSVRLFRFNRVSSVQATDEHYTLPQDVQSSLFT